MSTSLRSCADAGRLAPLLAWTMPIESSTVTNRSPAPASSRSVRPRHGRMIASAPHRTCERLSLVETCTVSAHRSIAAAATSVSGAAATRLPPKPTNTSTSPRCIAPSASTVSKPAWRGAAQQQGVGELLDGSDRLAVLGEPHRPADDDPLPAGDPAVQLVDRAAIEAGGRQQDVGIERVEVGAQLVEPVAVGIDERPV